MGGPVIWFDVVFSFLVALFWLRWFRKKDKYEKEPERLIFFAFFAGVLVTIPSVLLESFLRLHDRGSTVVLPNLFLSFLWVGIVEEFFKYLAVRVTVYRSKEFNEVMDGMIYMISAALGFAATENVGYMLGFGYSVGFPRAILSYLAHISFSAILGFYMGKAKIEGRKNLIWAGFTLAISLHWLYNAFLVAGTLKSSGGFLLLGLMVWVFGLILTLILVKKAQAVSPFRVAHILPKVLTKRCQACGKTVSSKTLVCHHCGESFALDEEEVTLKV
ncbi:MAG: PrsW family intramembrane metalloprotease [Deltaproteobacteria bacterium CG_4_8_14_3_um_filter_45_9]|nr:MAG: PrsW family intramembrane metalloprotease [Deltaproteobacteria bacterium CG03_land_8_20_14_0_80_45_14]PIX25520.1 MAG: PrsW family intramembrane metalloprotease [Deltaproteobacteria bacterium CG_4_8_14_3_um_filter_45_9]